VCVCVCLLIKIHKEIDKMMKNFV